MVTFLQFVYTCPFFYDQNLQIRLTHFLSSNTAEILHEYAHSVTLQYSDNMELIWTWYWKLPNGT